MITLKEALNKSENELKEIKTLLRQRVKENIEKGLESDWPVTCSKTFHSHQILLNAQEP